MQQESLENTAQGPKAGTSGISFLIFFKEPVYVKVC